MKIKRNVPHTEPLRTVKKPDPTWFQRNHPMMRNKNKTWTTEK